MSTCTDNNFELHPQLSADCMLVTELPLCRVLLMNDSQYPWLILVPRIADLREIIQLSPVQEQQLWRESRATSEALNELFSPDKLNMAALGNMVPQLHVHHVARFKDDAAWPGPIWGASKAVPYQKDSAEQRIEQLQQAIKERLC